MGIAAGSDGALWFTVTYSNVIGRITTDGTFTGYYDAGAPFMITTGPDGALWFGTDTYIGRITTQGEVSTFDTPNGGFGITAGSDGALWFTVIFSGVYNIGRVTTSGAFTYYPLPTPQDGPQVITTGPNGALWFTEDPGVEGLAGSIGEIVSAAASLAVTPDTGTFGTDISVTGSGFAPSENVHLFAHSTGAYPITTILADASGAFSLSTPIGAVPGGVHSLVGVGQSSANIGVGHYNVTELLSLTPNQGAPGTSVTAAGYGLRNGTVGETVRVFFGDLLLSEVQIDDKGSFSLNFTVPMLAPGTYSVSSGIFLAATFTIDQAVGTGPASLQTIRSAVLLAGLHLYGNNCPWRI